MEGRGGVGRSPVGYHAFAASAGIDGKIKSPVGFLEVYRVLISWVKHS